MGWAKASGRRAGCEPGQLRRLRRLGALQDRYRAGEAGRVRAQPPELQHRPSTHGGGGEPLHPRRRGGDRSDPRLLQRRHERADQERRSAGRLPACRREAGVRLGAQPRRDHPGDAAGGERCQREDLGRRVHRQHGEQLALTTRSRLGGPRRQQHGGAQLLHSGQQEGEEAQRSTVHPLRVVDHQRHRPLGRQVREQPVEPVEHREGRVRSGQRGLAGRAVRPRQAEQRCRDPGWALQERGTLAVRRLRQERLDQLPHHAERELALQLGTARPQHPEALGLRHLARGPEHHGLAHAGGPLDDERAASTLARPPQAPPDPLELPLALEQGAVIRRHA
jgi:hypothetical protein